MMHCQRLTLCDLFWCNVAFIVRGVVCRGVRAVARVFLRHNKHFVTCLIPCINLRV